jgi:hypothetical protein
MSLTAMIWAFNQDVTPTEKLVLLSIAEHANADGICWPGMAKIAEKTGLVRRTVIRAVEALDAAGIIGVERRRTGAGRQTSNLYRLDLGRGDTKSPGAVENHVDASSMSPGAVSSESPGEVVNVTRSSDTKSPCSVTESHTLNQSVNQSSEPGERTSQGGPSGPDVSLSLGQQVIEKVNEEHGLRWETPDQFLIDLLRGGASVADCLAVVRCKVNEWGGNARMQKRVRQVTLFNPRYWEGYIQQAYFENFTEERK